jgi:hypothetical protein
MMLRLSLIVGLAVGGLGFASQKVSAVSLPNSAVAAAASDGKLVQNVAWRCRPVRKKCALNWGWRTPAYRVCVAQYGCA